MATHKPKRSEWHLSKQGLWMRSFGERGYRIRLFQKRKGSVFFRAMWMPGTGGCDRKSLDTADRAEAEQRAKRLLAELLLTNDPTKQPAPLFVPQHIAPTIDVTKPKEVITLGMLWTRYSMECDEYLDNADCTRSCTASTIKVLLAGFGKDRDIRTITPTDLKEYSKKHRKGGIRCADRTVTDPVGQTSVHRDLTTLRTMTRWARTVFTAPGVRWLDHDPFDGLRFKKEPNPKRPVSSRDRYEKTRAAVQTLALQATQERYRLRWIRLELALMIVYATGRRRSAIVGLRWGDFDFANHRITWRAEHDKKRTEWVTPVPVAVIDALRQFRRQLRGLGGWVFPSNRNPTGHIPADMLSQWLKDAEEKAKLPKLNGGLWHPYRRHWATERMNFPVKALADAGGWKDVATLMKCYQQTDETTMLAVMTGSPPPDRGPAQPGSLSLVK